MKNRELAKEMKKKLGFNPADCRQIIIYCDTLGESVEGVEIVERALDLYIHTPEDRIERLTNFSNPK